jgi:hypothetical protein
MLFPFLVGGRFAFDLSDVGLTRVSIDLQGWIAGTSPAMTIRRAAAFMLSVRW